METRQAPPPVVTPDARPVRRAAVLVALQHRDHDWHLLLIRRASRVGDRHSGQVAFPGGKVETEDPTLTAAALREAEEEIGLPPDNVEVLGCLADYTTSTNFLVTPVVGLLKAPFNPTLQSSEVARLFSVPLRWLRNPENHEKRPWHGSGAEVIYFKDWQGENLWGATAAMTLQLLDALKQHQIVLPEKD